MPQWAWSLIQSVSMVIAGLATAGSVFWAVMQYRRSRRADQASILREEIHGLFAEMHRFWGTREPALFSLIHKCFYDGRVENIILSLLPNMDDKKSFDKALKERSREIHHALLVHGAGLPVEFSQPSISRMFRLRDSLKHRAPVLAELYSPLAAVVGTSCEEMHGASIRDSIEAALREMQQDGNRPREGARAVSVVFDNVLGHAALYVTNITYTQVFDCVTDILRAVHDIYSNANDDELLAIAARQRHVPLAERAGQFDARHLAQQLTPMIEWHRNNIPARLFSPIGPQLDRHMGELKQLLSERG